MFLTGQVDHIAKWLFPLLGLGGISHAVLGWTSLYLLTQTLALERSEVGPGEVAWLLKSSP